ncbi:hypothetical protein M231_01669 [Tremella mesenterica]|uniref:Uncharacterized protein n=1 Tax=Tremella mesenterica TaxID=5217 RepID=A0A4Q1BSU6_TREME|nr:uncharacterized protein TREMEDRAFT_66583 [Tremella mesenterica DSM 1558]EIW65450.1 hypothetical protein TREMEDRAFT_66583 [Tremella mesenterica DSM 1558]RXK41038.1 hypothetical protein M231_01669 [Tremella mesenterica]
MSKSSKKSTSIWTSTPLVPKTLSLFLPAIIDVLLFLSSTTTFPVFIYDQDGRTYDIAATGFGPNNYMGKWNYPPPEQWESPVTQIPLVLLLEFVLAILLGVFVLFLGYVMYANPKGISPNWRWFFTIIFIGLVELAGWWDFAIWQRAKAKGQDLNATVLGGFQSIGVGILGVIWLIAFGLTIKIERDLIKAKAKAKAKSRRKP